MSDLNVVSCALHFHCHEYSKILVGTVCAECASYLHSRRLSAVAEHGVPGFMLQCLDVETSQLLVALWQKL